MQVSGDLMKQILYLQDTQDKNGVQKGNSERIFNCEETEAKEELIGFFIGRRSCTLAFTHLFKGWSTIPEGRCGQLRIMLPHIPRLGSLERRRDKDLGYDQLTGLLSLWILTKLILYETI